MKITFCLPGLKRGPVGGYKVVYIYANALCERGHEVTIVHDNTNLTGRRWIDRVFLFRILLLIFLYGFKPRWYKLDKRINQVLMLNGFKMDKVPDGDAVVATASVTAGDVNRLSAKKGKKYYFIQGYEKWDNSEEDLIATYRMPFTFVTISAWLKALLEQYTEFPVMLIQNGIEFDDFYVLKDIDKRNPYTVAMLYHKLPNKGSKYGIRTLCKLKKKIPELHVNMFGTMKRPKNLPEWIDYTQKASKDELRYIYNNSSVFLCPTIREGFGLTGAESMACGCALVSTNYAGVREYAVDGRNSLLCDVKSENSLYKALKRCMEDNNLRIRLARTGNEDIQAFSWKSAIDKFERMLTVEKEKI